MKPNTYTQFNNVFLKLERARFHADELQKVIEDFLIGNPYKIEVVDKDQQQELRVRQVVNTPSIISLMLGDFIHNCRSSLDYLAVDLVLAVGGKISNNLYFPTGRDKAQFEGALAKDIRIAGDRFISELAKAELYRGGKGAVIRGLHELDIADKHNMLIPSISMVSFDCIRKKDPKNLTQITFSLKENRMVLVTKLSNHHHHFTLTGVVRHKLEIAGAEAFIGQSLPDVIESIYNEVFSLALSFKEYAKHSLQ